MEGGTRETVFALSVQKAEILEGGWNWGVSHSIDMRLVPSDDASFFP